MLSLCSKTTSLFLHTNGCSLEHQSVSSFSAVCIFECFCLLIFCACLISRFTCCVTCSKTTFFFLYVHTYGCSLKHQCVSLFTVCLLLNVLVASRLGMFSLVGFLVVLHATFFPACTYLWMFTETLACKFVSVVCTFECSSQLMFCE